LRYNEILDIDDTDKMIIELLEENPEMTHSAISEKVNKSQPAVGARIIKLKRKFLLSEVVGAEFNKLDVKLISLTPNIKEKTEEDEIGRMDIEIVACFTYLTLAKYLESVSKLPLLFKVQDLKIEKDKKIAPYLMVHLIMSSYFLSANESGK